MWCINAFNFVQKLYKANFFLSWWKTGNDKVNTFGQKHFHFYLLAICRVLPKHNAQRPSKEKKDWTLNKNKNRRESTDKFTKLRSDLHFINVMIVLFENCFLCLQLSCKQLHQLKLYYDLCHSSPGGLLPYMGYIGSLSLNRVSFFTLLFLCPWCGPQIG